MDGSWDSWTKIADCESLKPSGKPLGERGNVDEDILLQAQIFSFSGTPTAFRYIRIRVINTYDTEMAEKSFRIYELKLYGIEGESGNNGSGGGGLIKLLPVEW